MRVRDVNIVRIRATFIAAATTATTALSISTSGTLARSTTSLAGLTATTTLIVGSHGAYISAFVARLLAVSIVELCRRMHIRNEARKKFCSLVKI
jgi:phosphoribosylpyrophosphate synthetase